MALLKKGDAIGIVACSNPLSSTGRQQIRKLAEHLGTFGLRVRLSSGLYGEAGSFSLATAGNRADELMRMYEDPDIRMICDVSGGDLANTVLPFLDFSVIADNFKPFAGYSDLTAVVNAITVKTGRINFLYQIRHLEDPQYDPAVDVVVHYGLMDEDMFEFEKLMGREEPIERYGEDMSYEESGSIC